MTNLGTRSGTGGPGSGVITNDDDFLLELPAEYDADEKTYAKVKDDRSY